LQREKLISTAKIFKIAIMIWFLPLLQAISGEDKVNLAALVNKIDGNTRHMDWDGEAIRSNGANAGNEFCELERRFRREFLDKNAKFLLENN
jgi:hypothetical protein